MKRIYSHFDLTLSPETVESMLIYLQENSQYKYGKVEHNAEDYGITDEVIRENMKDYLNYNSLLNLVTN